MKGGVRIMEFGSFLKGKKKKKKKKKKEAK